MLPVLQTLYALVYAIFITSALCYLLITWANSQLSSIIVTAFWPVQVNVCVCVCGEIYIITCAATSGSRCCTCILVNTGYSICTIGMYVHVCVYINIPATSSSFLAISRSCYVNSGIILCAVVKLSGMKSKPRSDCWPSLMFSQEDQEKARKYGIFSRPIDCGLCDFGKDDSASPLLEKKKNVRRKTLNAFIII